MTFVVLISCCRYRADYHSIPHNVSIYRLIYIYQMLLLLWNDLSLPYTGVQCRDKQLKVCIFTTIGQLASQLTLAS